MAHHGSWTAMKPRARTLSVKPVFQWVCTQAHSLRNFKLTHHHHQLQSFSLVGRGDGVPRSPVWPMPLQP